MQTCKHCSERVAQIVNRATGQPILVDLNPDAALGVIRVDWETRTGEVLDLAALEFAIRGKEDLYVNHVSTCAGSDRDPQRSYAAQTERQVGA